MGVVWERMHWKNGGEWKVLGWTLKSSIGSRKEPREERALSSCFHASSLFPCPSLSLLSTLLSPWWHDFHLFFLFSLLSLSHPMDMGRNLILERKFGRLEFAMEVEWGVNFPVEKGRKWDQRFSRSRKQRVCFIGSLLRSIKVD